jgi:hypothetical protein
VAVNGKAIGETVMMLRLWLHGGRGQLCSVFVTRISHQRELVEDVRSPLEWTYTGGFTPMTINDPFKEGRYIDLAIGRNGSWLAATELAKARFKKFSASGVYAFHLSIEAVNLGKRQEAVVTIAFDGTYKSFDFYDGQPKKATASARVDVR